MGSTPTVGVQTAYGEFGSAFGAGKPMPSHMGVLSPTGGPALPDELLELPEPLLELLELLELLPLLLDPLLAEELELLELLLELLAPVRFRTSSEILSVTVLCSEPRSS